MSTRQLESVNSSGELNTIKTKGTGADNTVLNQGELKSLLSGGSLTSIKKGGTGFKQELLTEAEVEALVPALHAYSRWRGQWERGVDYYPDDLVSDMCWLMDCTAFTRDRAAPLIMGGLYNEFAPDAGPTFGAADGHGGLVMFGHEYTVTEEGYLDAVEVILPVINPTTTYYDVYFGWYDSNGVLIKSRLHGVKLTENAWSNMHVPKRYFKKGDKFRVEIWTKEVTGAAPRLDHTYVLRNKGGDPADGEISWISDTEVRISKKDKTGADLTTAVDSIIPGERILLTDNFGTGNYLDFEVLEPAVDAGTYVIVTGGRKVGQRGFLLDNDFTDVTLDSESLALGSVAYNHETAYTWRSPFATVRGLLYQDGLDQNAAADAFGIRTWWQEANASENWAVVRMPDESYAKSGSLSFG